MRSLNALGCARDDLTEPHNPAWLAVVVALFVALPAIVAPYGQEAKYGYSPDLHMAAYLQVLGCLLAVVLFVQRVTARQWVLRFDGLFLLLSLVVTWALLSLLWAHNLYDASVKLFNWLAALLGAFLVVQVIRTPRHLRFFMEALFWSGVALALLGIAQYLYGVNWVAQAFPPAATFGNRNMAAQYYLLTFPLGVALYLRNDKRLMGWFYAFGAALIVIATLYTRTRAAWLALLFALVILCGFFLYEIGRSRNPFANKRGNVAIMAAAVFILIAAHFNAKGAHWFGGEIVEIASETAQEVRFDGAGNGRISVWANTLAMIGDHPVLGVGLGNWNVEYPFYHTRVFVDRQMGLKTQFRNAHNDYLEIVAELGVIGGLLIVWVAVAIFRKFLKVLADETHEFRTMLVCLFAALAAIAVDALFSFPFQQPVPLFLTFIYMSLLASLCRSHPQMAAWWRGQGFGVRINRNAIGYALIALFVVGFVVMLAVNVRLYQSQQYFWKAKIEQGRKDYESMLSAARRAHQLNPHRDRLLYLVALGHHERGEYHEAIEYFERALVSYPYLLQVLPNLSLSYWHAGYPEKALEKWQILESIRPHDHRVAAEIALLLNQLKRTEEALAYMKKAVELAPAGEKKARLQALYDQGRREACPSESAHCQ